MMWLARARLSTHSGDRAGRESAVGGVLGPVAFELLRLQRRIEEATIEPAVDLGPVAGELELEGLVARVLVAGHEEGVEQRRQAHPQRLADEVLTPDLLGEFGLAPLREELGALRFV